ncbi:hypothetical protein DXU06_20370 [Bradyrhizobium elkanii]
MFFTDKKPAGGGKITIVLKASDGVQDGPHVEIHTGTKINEQMTLKEFQLEHFESALQLLRRIARETPESLRDKWLELMNREES